MGAEVRGTMPWSALVLCAGYSSRMGSPKAWLRMGARTLLEHVVESALLAGAHEVVVVVGQREPRDPRLVDARRVWQVLEGRSIGGIPGEARRPTVGPESGSRIGARVRVACGVPDGGPIDSIRRGLHHCERGRAVLLWPVDAPFADVSVVAKLVDALKTCSARDTRIAVPVFGSRRGHPVLFGAKVACELAGPAADAGARGVVRRCSERVVAVPVSDPRVVDDVDTPRDARRLGLVGLDSAPSIQA
jgi:molybdenum cofactor cytidylyltransferase